MASRPPEFPDDPTETIDLPGIDRPRAEASGFALIVASGPRRGQHWPVGDGVEAGRHPEADIFLDDVTVSRHHCAFALVEEGLEVRDLGSTNGTYVNGVRCEASLLHPGDEVFIGRFHLVVARDS